MAMRTGMMLPTFLRSALLQVWHALVHCGQQIRNIGLARLGSCCGVETLQLVAPVSWMMPTPAFQCRVHEPCLTADTSSLKPQAVCLQPAEHSTACLPSVKGWVRQVARMHRRPCRRSMPQLPHEAPPWTALPVSPLWPLGYRFLGIAFRVQGSGLRLPAAPALPALALGTWVLGGCGCLPRWKVEGERVDTLPTDRQELGLPGTLTGLSAHQLV